SYAGAPSVTTIGQGRGDAYEPEKIFGGFMPARSRRGDARDGLASADLGVDATFRFAPNHHNALEPMTTTAVWEDDRL
ncbi:xanthine dehydrogenase family protein molybdopterin-binding subunit, partial [Actinomadura welshii]